MQHTRGGDPWPARDQADRRRGDRSLQHYFTRRAQAAAIITGALSLATLAELHISNAALFSRLTGRALALVTIAGLCGLAVLGLLTASRPRSIRVPAALGVAAVIWGGAWRSTRSYCQAPQ